MIAHNKYFVGIIKHNEPVEEVKHLLFGAAMGEVAAMHNHIGWRQCPQPAMQPVRVTDVKNSHIDFPVSASTNRSITYSFKSISFRPSSSFSNIIASSKSFFEAFLDLE